MGTSLGEIFQVQITKDNKVLQKKIISSPMMGKQVSALACDKQSGVILAGTTDGCLFQMSIGQEEDLKLLKDYP